MKISTFVGLSASGVFLLTCLGAAVTASQAIHYKKLDDQHRACVTSLAADNVIDPARLCAPAIADAHAKAVFAAVCDRSLDARPENLAAVRMVCSTAVKGLVAERDVARAERDGLASDLQITRAGQADAIRRAEARIQTKTQRKLDAAAVLARAPRDGHGLVLCDAGCLRERAGPLP